MKHKISLILLVTLSFSLFSFYSVHKIKNKVNWIPKFRHLDGAAPQQIKELCEKADKKLFKYYYEEGSYDTDFEGNSEDSQTLINLIRDQNTEDIKEYVTKCAKWLVFIVFGILAIIGWIVCCCCCCCNCCCFKNCCTSKILQFIIFVLCAACYGCVAILGIYTAASADNALKGLNNTSCSLLSFVDDIIRGQKRTTVPYWKGIDGLKDILQSIENGINSSINNNKQDFYDATDDYEDFINDADTQIQSMSDGDVKPSGTLYSFQLPNDGRINALKDVAPICITQWTTTFKDSFTNEYNIIKQSSYSVITEMSSIFNDVTGCPTNCGKSSTFDAISDSIKAVDDISGSFKDLQDQITDPWYDLQSTINDVAEKGLKIAGSVICVFCASICALILLYKLLDCIGKIFKIIIHVLWNIVALTIIVSFILGGVIGLLGKIGIDLVSVMNYIISEENLNKETPDVIENIGNKDYLIECLHRDGNLSKVLELGTKAKAIDDLNIIKTNLTNLKEQFGGQTQSIAPHQYHDLLTSKYFSNQFFLVDGSGTYDFDTDLGELNDKLKQNNINEYWGYDESKTPDSEKQKTFINIYNLPSNYDTRYDSNTAVDSSATTLGARITQIKNYFTNVPTGLKTKEVDIKDQMDGIYQSLNSAIDSSLTIISAITDKLNENVGADGELWAMINCKFMGEGVKVLLKNLHDGLGTRFVKLGNTLVAMAFLEAFAIVFTLLTLKKPDKEPNKEK